MYPSENADFGRCSDRLTFFRSAAACLHVPTRLTRDSAKYEPRKRRANERHAVGCCEELGARAFRCSLSLRLLCFGPTAHFANSDVPARTCTTRNELANSSIRRALWAPFGRCFLETHESRRIRVESRFGGTKSELRISAERVLGMG